MIFTSITGGSKAITVDSILAWLFPPRITALDSDSLKDSLGYQYRITRRGEERNPTTYVGAQIVRVIEGRARYMPKSGTREARRYTICA